MPKHVDVNSPDIHYFDIGTVTFFCYKSYSYDKSGLWYCEYSGPEKDLFKFDTNTGFIRKEACESYMRKLIQTYCVRITCDI